MRKRRRFSGDLQAKVALETLRGDRTLQEIASYPWIVRRAAWNSRKPCLAFTRRLIAR